MLICGYGGEGRVDSGHGYIGGVGLPNTIFRILHIWPKIKLKIEVSNNFSFRNEGLLTYFVHGLQRPE